MVQPIRAIQPIGSRRRKSRTRPERPPFSIDLKAERRKRKRVSIEELSARGADAIPKQETKRLDRRSSVTRVLDLIDVPRNIIANVIGSLVGVDRESKPRGTLIKKVFFSDILAKLGVKKGAVRSIVGFIGDVGIDPLTYLSLGASTGTSVGRHLPRLTGAAHKALKVAKKTGQIGEDLAKAIGTTRAGRISRAFTLQAAKTGFRKDAAGQIIKRFGKKSAQAQTGKRIAAGLRRGALGQTDEALEFFARHGERGRTLLRAPFAARGIGVVPFGKKARNFQAVQAALGPGVGGAESVAAVGALKNTIAALKKSGASQGQEVIALRGAADTATAAEKAAHAAHTAAFKVPGARSRTIQSPATEALAAAKAKWVASQGRKIKSLERAKGSIPTLRKGAARDVAGAAETVEELKAFRLSPEAPAIQKRLLEVKLGAAAPVGGGIINLLRRGKHAAFGPGTSELNQLRTGIAQRVGPGARAAGVRAADLIASEATPIVNRLAATGKFGSVDDVIRDLSRLVESGPDGAFLGQFASTDEALTSFKRIRDSGLMEEPGVRGLIDNFAERMSEFRRKDLAAGFDVGQVAGFESRILTPEARASMAIQGRQGKIAPFSGLGRAKLVDIRMPDGEIVRTVSTNVDDIEAALARGGEAIEGGVKEISIAEINKRSRAQGAARGVVTPDFKKDLFVEDIVQSGGARAAQSERRAAAADLRSLTEEYGVSVPKRVGAKDPRFAHLSELDPPPPNGPFSQLDIYKDKLYPRPVADAINRLNQVWESPEAIRSLMGASDKVLGWWKAQALYHPSYVIRNVFQNFFGGLMAGADPLQVASRTLGTEVKVLREALVLGDPAAIRGLQFNFKGITYSADELFEFARKNNMVGAGRVAQEIAPASLKAGAPAVHGARRFGRKLHQAIFKANTKVEDRQRLGTWFHFMDKGMDPTDAMLRTLRAMPDLSDLTLWEKNVAARVFPWWRWMRHNGALQLFEHLPQRPAYAAMLPRFKNFVEGVRGKDIVPDELRPMWQQEQIGAQVSGDADGGMAWMMQNWFPFEDIYAIGSLATGQPEEGIRRFVSGTRPELKFAAEAATEQSIFKRTPLEPLGSASLNPLTLAQGKTGTALDSLTTIRAVREFAPGGRVSDIEGLGNKAVRSVIGGALQPVDRERGLLDLFFELDSQQRKLRADYNRALSANDQGTADGLYRQWLAVQRQMFEFQFPIPRALEEEFVKAGVPQPGPPR